MPFSRDEIIAATTREHAVVERECAELMDTDLFKDDLSEAERRWIKESFVLASLDPTDELERNTDFSLGCIALGIPIRFSWGLKESQKLAPEDVLSQIRGQKYDHFMSITVEGQKFFVVSLTVVPPDAYAKALGPDAKLEITEYEIPDDYWLVPGSIVPMNAEIFHLEVAEIDFISHG